MLEYSNIRVIWGLYLYTSIPITFQGLACLISGRLVVFAYRVERKNNEEGNILSEVDSYLDS